MDCKACVDRTVPPPRATSVAPWARSRRRHGRSGPAREPTTAAPAACWRLPVKVSAAARLQPAPAGVAPALGWPTGPRHSLLAGSAQIAVGPVESGWGQLRCGGCSGRPSRCPAVQCWRPRLQPRHCGQRPPAPALRGSALGRHRVKASLGAHSHRRPLPTPALRLPQLRLRHCCKTQLRPVAAQRQRRALCPARRGHRYPRSLATQSVLRLRRDRGGGQSLEAPPRPWQRPGRVWPQRPQLRLPRRLARPRQAAPNRRGPPHRWHRDRR
mmetsp:Transcript_131652/g.366913  ORF Transcript_131652/g.366913 Transcript_131652/m.366913 type:complete len:270 (-) Transcript_131652:1252-2061(-)